MAKFEIFKGKDGKFYFHLKSSNGEIIAQSQGYSSKQHAESGVAAVQDLAPTAELVDLAK